MVLPDVNILVYAHRADAPGHAAYLEWLGQMIQSDLAYGMCDLVLSGFLRVVTHPRIFSPPSLLDDALAFVEEVRSPPNCVIIDPGPRHLSSSPASRPTSAYSDSATGIINALTSRLPRARR